MEFKKDGTLSSRSDVMDEAEMEEISRFVTGKVKKLGREILEGKVSCNPYKKDKESACTYCPYKGVCGFDTAIPTGCCRTWTRIPTWSISGRNWTRRRNKLRSSKCIGSTYAE